MGHKQGHLRAAFTTLVAQRDCGEWFDPTSYEECFWDEAMPESRLVWEMGDCDDIMPRELCEALCLPTGASYAMGAGAYLASYGLSEN